MPTDWKVVPHIIESAANGKQRLIVRKAFVPSDTRSGDGSNMLSRAEGMV